MAAACGSKDVYAVCVIILTSIFVCHFHLLRRTYHLIGIFISTDKMGLCTTFYYCTVLASQFHAVNMGLRLKHISYRINSFFYDCLFHIVETVYSITFLLLCEDNIRSVVQWK